MCVGVELHIKSEQNGMSNRLCAPIIFKQGLSAQISKQGGNNI